jgi:hypothetical protein
MPSTQTKINPGELVSLTFALGLADLPASARDQLSLVVQQRPVPDQLIQIQRPGP